MFEFHDELSAQDVAAFFGPGVELVEGLYVEDIATGEVLAAAGGLGRDQSGQQYLLRWNGRTLPLHARTVRRETSELDGLEWRPARKPAHVGDPAVDRWGVPRLTNGGLVVFTIEELGTSVYTILRTKAQPVHLQPDEVEAALRVATEACLVLESSLEWPNRLVRVSDPCGGGRELSPADYGYPSVMSRRAALYEVPVRPGDPGGGA
ncbi:hypothetical protein [Jannaschia sp. R86511]|uniref:hypothetical protein n=1 Tax=Jannaschia sp. R86511 TaxID=3093853 RepID=UPI0036D2787E